MTRIVCVVLGAALCLTATCGPARAEIHKLGDGLLREVTITATTTNTATTTTYKTSSGTQTITQTDIGSYTPAAGKIPIADGNLERSTGDSAVSAELVATVQSALRWSRPAWPASRCEAVAAALSVLPEPLTMLAVAVNESGMRADAIRGAGNGVFDVGLMGIRCRVRPGDEVTAPANGAGPAESVTKSKTLTDGSAGRCQNGPARGYTVNQLLDPVVNIRVAHVLATLKGPAWLDKWNGDSGYANRIGVLIAALAGIPVEVTGRGRKWDRIMAIVDRILRATSRERGAA